MVSPSKEKTKQFNFEKYFKDGVQMIDSQEDFINNTVATNLITLDLATGGGIPHGRIIEIYGPSGCGKTSMAIQIGAAFQRHGNKVAFIDMERTFTQKYANQLNCVDIFKARPHYGEQALEMTVDLLESGYKYIIIDSVAALVPKAEVEEAAEGSALGLMARMMSRWIRKIIPVASQNDGTVVFINQLRSQMSTGYMVNPETTPGGKSLGFFSSMRFEVRRIGTIKSADNVANEIRLRIIKNKMDSDQRLSESVMHFYPGRGFCPIVDMIRWGERLGCVIRSGSWLKMADDTPLGQGMNSAYVKLTEDKELYEKLKHDVVEGLVSRWPDYETWIRQNY